MLEQNYLKSLIFFSEHPSYGVLMHNTFNKVQQKVMLFLKQSLCSFLFYNSKTIIDNACFNTSNQYHNTKKDFTMPIFNKCYTTEFSNFSPTSFTAVGTGIISNNRSHPYASKSTDLKRTSLCIKTSKA